MSADMFGDLFGGGPYPTPQQEKPKTEKGVPWHAKQIDGALYLPLTEVVELLKVNDVLPAVRRGLERHL